MMPHKTVRGNEAMGRLKCFEGIPAPYDTTKRMVIPEALRVLRLKHGSKYCRLGDLSTQVGWKHGDTVARLEDKRRERAAEWFKNKQAQVTPSAPAHPPSTPPCTMVGASGGASAARPPARPSLRPVWRAVCVMRPRCAST